MLVLNRIAISKRTELLNLDLNILLSCLVATDHHILQKLAEYEGLN